jgi:hypothetical protein
MGMTTISMCSLTVGRIIKAVAVPVGMSCMWTLAFGYHEGRTVTHGGLHRIGGVRGGRIRLASPSGRFSLGSEGVTYFGIFIDHPAIPTSSLLKQPEREPGAIHQPHFIVDCRVFKER